MWLHLMGGLQSGRELPFAILEPRYLKQPISGGAHHPKL